MFGDHYDFGVRIRSDEVLQAVLVSDALTLTNDSASNARLQILRAKDCHVMQLVPGDDVRERPHRHFAVIRRAPAEPRSIRQVLK